MVPSSQRKQILRVRATQGKYEDAGLLYLRAIEIGEKTLGPDHPDLAARLNNRASFLAEQVSAIFFLGGIGERYKISGKLLRYPVVVVAPTV